MGHKSSCLLWRERKDNGKKKHHLFWEKQTKPQIKGRQITGAGFAQESGSTPASAQTLALACCRTAPWLSAWRTGTEWLQSLRLHLCWWMYLLLGLWPYSPLWPSWRSCSDSPIQRSTLAVSPLVSVGTEYSSCPACYICAFSLCSASKLRCRQC